MPKLKSETRWVPCVARHFTNKAVSYAKSVDTKFSALAGQIEKYDGCTDPRMVEALAECKAQADALQVQVIALARLCDERSSQPIF